MGADKIRVLIADDHAVVREGVRTVLESAKGFEVVGEADDGDRAIALAAELEPDVVVLDLSMPRLSGLNAITTLRDRAPSTRVLILSIHEDEEYVLQAVRLGAGGYLKKDSTPKQLREAVQAVARGDTYFSAPVARALSAGLSQEKEGGRLESLTGRERDVLLGIAGGDSNKDIAKRLGISVRTVESHRETLMKKLHVRGVAGLTRLAIEAGLIRSTTES